MGLLMTRACHFNHFLFSQMKLQQQVGFEFLRESTSIGKSDLVSGEGVIKKDFEPRGKFKLRFDANEFEDLWIVVDWSE